MENLIVFVALIILLISVLCIYGARGIVRKKVDIENENKVVVGIKVVCYMLVLLSLAVLCYLK
jgi:ABC-type transport system involved in multi-copper enzyme maturation permease subunit